MPWLFAICLLLSPVGILNGEAFAAQKITAETAPVIKPETTSGLRALFQTLDYAWMSFDNDVPPLILEQIPTDINSSVGTKTKKKTFFLALLPMVLLANQEINQERQEIQQILARHQTRKKKTGDGERIRIIAKRYGLRGRPLTDHRARRQLLQRVDRIPPALVLAQAANESAWGTSRFAQKGNNLFGEWTFKPGTGLVPAGRPAGETYEVRVFTSIYQSIRSYMNNLNRNGAYRKLRAIRAELRKKDKPVTGSALSKGLINYSQRGEEYIKEIGAMIRQNSLEQVNLVKLRQPQEEFVTTIDTTGSGLFSTRNRLIGHTQASRQDP
jgi:Bax protein